MDIQTFRAEHQPGIVELILSIQQAEFGLAITLEAQPDLLNIPEFYQHGNGNFWVAISQGVAIGTISLLDIGNDCGH